MTNYYQRDPLERATVIKGRTAALRCDAEVVFKGRPKVCNALLLERCQPGGGGVVVIKCPRCGKKHEVRG